MQSRSHLITNDAGPRPESRLDEHDHLPRRGMLGYLARASAVAFGLTACASVVAATVAPGTTAIGFEPPPDPVATAGPDPVPPLVVDSPPAGPTPVPGPPRIPIYYRPDYTLAGFSFETTRKSAWVADSLVARPFSELELLSPELLDEAAITAIHDRSYVAAVQSGNPRTLAESQGFKWDPGLWQMVLASNGGAVDAARAALRAGVAGSLSSGLHHARRARGNGYCTFNGLALAAKALLADGAQRVLVVDLDAHCGGGTNELLGRITGVRILDVAVDPFDTYTPVGQNTLDVVRAAGNYLPTVQRRLDALRGATFDICLYNAGMDPHEGCAIGGLKGITHDMLAAREQLVFEWCRQRNLPISFVLAGGYLGPKLDQEGLTSLHRLTLAAAASMPVR